MEILQSLRHNLNKSDPEFTSFSLVEYPETTETLKLQSAIQELNTTFIAKLPSNCWLAGGAIADLLNNKIPKDYDLFFANKSDLMVTHQFLIEKFEVTLINKTDNRIKLKISDVLEDSIIVELIFKYFPNPLETIKSFDFTACCFAYQNQTIYYHEDAVKDTEKQEIYLNTCDYPIDTLRRTYRYVEKGFTITNEAQAMLVKAIWDIDEDTLNNKTNQLYYE